MQAFNLRPSWRLVTPPKRQQEVPARALPNKKMLLITTEAGKCMKTNKTRRKVKAENSRRLADL
jgi:hypothetical protein